MSSPKIDTHTTSNSSQRIKDLLDEVRNPVLSNNETTSIAEERNETETQSPEGSITDSPVWKELLEENLRAQGGDEIENIKIDKVDSFVWSHEGVSLNVESVVITLRGRDNQSTKFRAIVDAQNGKILNSWDQPIVEYADPSKRRGIKIDPRYHQ